MTSFYGNYWGDDSGNGSSTGGAASNIVFVDSVDDLPKEGEENTLYVTTYDGIYICEDGYYINTSTIAPDLVWEDYNG